jgi:hypothetical protein
MGDSDGRLGSGVPGVAVSTATVADRVDEAGDAEAADVDAVAVGDTLLHAPRKSASASTAAPRLVLGKLAVIDSSHPLVSIAIPGGVATPQRRATTVFVAGR